MEPVHRRRALLCDLVEDLTDEQWAAETMCQGWDTGDVVAHLLVREREPWASAGLLVPPLAWLHESRMASRKQSGREAMQQRLREGPPTLATLGIVGRIQVGEDYIHTEDIRRGGAADVPGRSRADLKPDDGTGDAATDEILWEAVGRFSLQTLGGIEADGTIALTDGQRSRAYALGGRLARRAHEADPDRTVTVAGPMGELLLFTTGRHGARVEITGPDDLIEALRTSRQSV